MNTTYDDIPDNDDLIAAEYVLGLLDSGARRDAESRLKSDAVFASLVVDWESWFSPWLEAIDPVAAPDELWPRIRAALWQHELPERTTTMTSERPSLWSRLSFWRGLAAGGFAVAAASIAALVVGVRSMPEPVPPSQLPTPVVTAPAPTRPAAPMAVSLVADDGTAAYNAVMNPDTGVIVLVPANVPDDARVPELWLIGDDGVPKSLGVIARDHAQQVRVPEAIRDQAATNAVFAITLEPEGGSPTGDPTGPVVAKGSLIQL